MTEGPTVHNWSDRLDHYRVLFASDTAPGFDDRHLLEAARIGVVHARSPTVVEGIEGSARCSGAGGIRVVVGG